MLNEMSAYQNKWIPYGLGFPRVLFFAVRSGRQKSVTAPFEAEDTV